MVADQLSSQLFTPVSSCKSRLGWLHNIIGLSIKGWTFTSSVNMKPQFLHQYLVFFNKFLKKIIDHTSTNILTQKSRF